MGIAQKNIMFNIMSIMASLLLVTNICIYAALMQDCTAPLCHFPYLLCVETETHPHLITYMCTYASMVMIVYTCRSAQCMNILPAAVLLSISIARCVKLLCSKLHTLFCIFCFSHKLMKAITVIKWRKRLQIQLRCSH